MLVKNFIKISGFHVLLIASILFSVKAKAQERKIDYSDPKSYTLAGVNVEGANFNDKNALISISGLKVGQKIKIPGDDISTAIRKLWKLGIVGDVRIKVADIVEEEIYLTIELKERPRLSRYYIEGVPKGQHSTLKEKIKLIKGRILTDAIIKNAKNIIAKHYAEKGFKNTTVKPIIKKDSILSNSVILTLMVDKKEKVKIEEIDFSGVSKLSEKKVKRKMKKTKEKNFFRIFTPSKFVKKEYENDKKNVVDYYNKEGFRDAKIERDSVYDISDDLIKIEIDIEEGKKYYYRDISWEGNYKYDSETLAKVLGIQKGDIFNPEELNKRLNFNPTGTDISSLYMDDGYLFFSVEPIELRVEEDSIDIQMRIYEGDQATINKIIVNGNTKTSDHVIYRELRTVPGEKFSRSDLIRTQRELAALQYFDPEQIGINPKPNMSDGTVDIEYDLVEKASDQIELSGGWGGGFGFIGTLGVVFNNFSLRNVFNLESYRPLPAGDGQRLQLRMQANGRLFQNYSISFTEPWLGGKKPNSFTFSTNYSINRFQRSDALIKMRGASVMLGRRLRWPDDFFVMTNSLSFNYYTINEYNIYQDFNNGDSYSLTFNTTFSRNSIDNPTFPRTGSNLSLSVNLTPPYSTFDNRDYNTLSTAEKFKWVEYHKWMFDNSWFIPLANKLVLNSRVHFGFLGAYNNEKGTGPFERFVLGGDGLAQNNRIIIGTDIIGLRGYQNQTITPGRTSDGGVTFAKYVTELRYAISLNPSATIYVLGFMEGGNNWGSLDEFDPFNVYRSAGVGARIFMPAFGLLGIDCAWGFDDVPGRPDANGQQFHFTIGTQPFR